MYIAAEKKKNNIIEYLLYMWQIEDMIRANHFDINTIRKNIIDKFQLEDNQKNEMELWYRHHIEMMTKEDIMASGHLKYLQDIVYELNDLHLSLINDLNQEQYLSMYNWAKANIKTLKKKVGDESMCEIEVCLNGLYGLLIMRLRKIQLSEDTMESISTFSNMLALLATHYRKLMYNL